MLGFNFLNKRQENSQEIDGISISVPKLIETKKYANSILTPPTLRSTNVISGMYRSAFRGMGMDFEEVRIYQPGDDIRTIDWRVTARNGKPHTKVFKEEKERSVYLFTDMGVSQYFGSKVCYKSYLAAKIASMIGWAVLESSDRIGGGVYGGGEKFFITPKKNTNAFLRYLGSLSLASKGKISTLKSDMFNEIKLLRKKIKTGSGIFIISDFANVDDAFLQNMAELTRIADVFFVQTYDVLEGELPNFGILKVTDGKNCTLLNCFDYGYLNNYKQKFEEKRKSLEQFCKNHKISYINVRTDEPDIPKRIRLGIFKKNK